MKESRLQSVSVAGLSFLIKLCACWDVWINHEEVELFFVVALIDGADEHAAGVDAHHWAWWQVGDGDQGFADEFFWLVVLTDAAKDGAVGA